MAALSLSDYAWFENTVAVSVLLGALVAGGVAALKIFRWFRSLGRKMEALTGFIAPWIGDGAENLPAAIQGIRDTQEEHGRLIAATCEQVHTNHGSTLKDAVGRVEVAVDGIREDLANASDDRADLRARIEGVNETVAVVQDVAVSLDERMGRSEADRKTLHDLMRQSQEDRAALHKLVDPLA